jgi:outer membrane protein TolC
MKYAVNVILSAAVLLNAAVLPIGAEEIKQKNSTTAQELFKTEETGIGGLITIDQAVNVALEQNSSVVIAQKTAQIYDQQVRQYWSYVYPSVKLEGSYSRALRPQSTITSMGSFRFSLDNATSASAEASLLLWKGGAVIAGINMGKMYSQSGYLQLKETQNNIKNMVSTLCYGIVLSHAVAQVEQMNLDISKDHLKEIQLKYKQGLASDLDVLTQQVKVANSEPSLIKALNNYDLGLLQLRRLLNKDPEEPLYLTWEIGEVLDTKTPELGELYAMAEEGRPEIVISSLNVKIAEEQIKIARADHFGEVSAFVNAKHTGSSDSVIIPTSSDNSSYGTNAGLKISIPLFEGFRVSSVVKQKQLAYEQAVLQDQDAKRNVRIAVKTAWLNLQESRKRIGATQDTIAQAMKNLERTTLRYRNGLASRLDLDDSALALHDAQVQYVQAVHDALTAIADLNYAVGKEVIIK